MKNIFRIHEKNIGARVLRRLTTIRCFNDNNGKSYHPAQILLRGKFQRHKDSNLGHANCKPVDFSAAKLAGEKLELLWTGNNGEDSDESPLFIEEVSCRAVSRQHHSLPYSQRHVVQSGLLCIHQTYSGISSEMTACNSCHSSPLWGVCYDG